VIGNVDDGKSTLVGRLLFDSDSLFPDQLQAMKQGSALELAWATDGLAGEREQGITIDVAYRHFSTGLRDFIIADTPGHVQYVRNMASGVSFSHLAIVLVDVTKGVTEQTRRHLSIASLMGVSEIIIAINKMDAVEYSQERFAKIEKLLREHLTTLHFSSIEFIPTSGLKGDLVTRPSPNMPWFIGLDLLENLNQRPVPLLASFSGVRLPIQRVSLLKGQRYYAGRLLSGTLTLGDSVRLEPSGRTTQVTGLFLGETQSSLASAGDSISVTLADQVDVNRGEMIVDSKSRVLRAQKILARLVWFGRQTLECDASHFYSRGLILKQGPFESKVAVSEIKLSKSVSENEIADVVLEITRPLTFDPASVLSPTSKFILIDTVSQATVAVGQLLEALTLSINSTAVSGRTIWMTGLSGAGKTTLAQELFHRLNLEGQASCILDGDLIRQGLSKDLGFTEAARAENIRRVAETAKILNSSGVNAIVALISPSAPQRAVARSIVGQTKFDEVFVDAPLQVCEGRDPKGLYKKARNNEIPNFTGISAGFDVPAAPDLHLRTDFLTVDECISAILQFLKTK
jgi:bifunctional enzyme CysN/CysC